MFHNLINYVTHLIIQELGKFNFKVNVIANVLEKYTGFSLDNKLNLIDSFQFFTSSLDSLAKNLDENDFKHLGQEFNSDYPCEYMCDFEKFNETMTSKNKFYSSLSDKGISVKEYQPVLKDWGKN